MATVHRMDDRSHLTSEAGSWNHPAGRKHASKEEGHWSRQTGKIGSQKETWSSENGYPAAGD